MNGLVGILLELANHACWLKVGGFEEGPETVVEIEDPVGFREGIQCGDRFLRGQKVRGGAGGPSSRKPTRQPAAVVGPGEQVGVHSQPFAARKTGGGGLEGQQAHWIIPHHNAAAGRQASHRQFAEPGEGLPFGQRDSRRVSQQQPQHHQGQQGRKRRRPQGGQNPGVVPFPAAPASLANHRQQEVSP